MTSWGLAERRVALERAEREGVDLLVIGGGITGAGVLRDAASRGLRALLVERADFAAGTSSRSSKMLHGGLRYLAEGAFGITYQSCRERDRLAHLNPNLVRRVPFLFPAYADDRLPAWQVHAGLFLYRLLAGFRDSASYRMVSPEEVARFCPALRREGLRAAGIYHDARVDDARLVVQSLKSARALGAEAVSYAEVVEFVCEPDTTVRAVRVRDRLGGRTREIRAHVVVNATGPGVERVRGLHRPRVRPQMRPAKGIHLVIDRHRVPARGTVTFEAPDGRHVFLSPWEDVALIGTTDTFSDEIDEPRTSPEEVAYLLTAANRAFPTSGLTHRDVRAAFAGVRPLVAPPDSQQPPSAVSREHRVTDDGPNLISVAGGKLTLYRAMGQEIVDRALERLPAERRARAGPSRTWELPLRDDDFDRGELVERLRRRHRLVPARAEHLVAAWGAEAQTLLEAAPPALRAGIGGTPFVYAEIPWALRTECAASLCDVLERRVRLALFARDQGFPQRARLAAAAGAAAGWDAERARAEAERYAETLARDYRAPAPAAAPTSQSAA